MSDLERLTERQREAAELPTDVAIVAGAGTGKTHTLGHRYLAHLDGGRSPLEIVAVTFTERAAHELRARVRRYARARWSDGDPRLDELEAATIGTVHALCLRIVREHPTAAEVPPDARVLDPLEGGVWSEERLEDALARVPSALFEVLPYERVREVLRELLKDPYAAEAALTHGPDAWPDTVARARGEARSGLSSVELREARATLASLRGPDGDAGERTRVAILAAFDAADDDDPDAAAAAIHGKRSNVGSAKVWGDRQDKLRTAVGTSLAGLRAWLEHPYARLDLGPNDALLAETLPALREAFAFVRGALTRAKRRAGVLDFADLEIAALRALNDPDVTSHYAERWRVLLVDEVQDTSPVQEAIVARLASFCRTTLVGDAKQSIYGFRGADASVFRRMTASLTSGGGRRVVLDRSFRTHAPLVRSLNEVFAPLLEAMHEPLTAQRTDPPGLLDRSVAYVRAWHLEDTRGVPSTLVRLAEAQRIADEIRAAIDEGRAVRDDDAPGGTRPMRPGDVAVLARTWAPLDLLAEVLPARGVPAVHTGGGDLLVTREAQDGVAALRFLADPSDDVALVALLRGPCFAVADDDLDAFAEATAPQAGQRGVAWWQRLERSDAPWAARARAVLNDLLDAARHERASRLLQRLDRHTGWSAVVANLPGGPRRLADLQGFAAFVRNLERDGSDVFGVVRRIRRLQRANVEVPRPALDAEDAVTLTTVHRAKGLEWPMVIVAALDVRGRGSWTPVRLAPDVGVALRLDTADDRNAKPALWTLLDERAKTAEQDELRRLLYVAFTRAEDYLVASTGPARGPANDLLASGFAAAGIVSEPLELRLDAIAWPDPPLPPTSALGPRAPSATLLQTDRSTPPSAGDDLWELVIDRAAQVAPEAGEMLVRLRAAGAPVPVTTLRAEGGGLGGTPWTLARWEGPENGSAPAIVLHERGDEVPDEEGVIWIGFDPLEPESAERRLSQALGLSRAP